jgi:hypothetical protein
VITTLRYFRDEYQSHLEGGECPVCKTAVPAGTKATS